MISAISILAGSCRLSFLQQEGRDAYPFATPTDINAMKKDFSSLTVYISAEISADETLSWHGSFGYGYPSGVYDTADFKADFCIIQSRNGDFSNYPSPQDLREMIRRSRGDKRESIETLSLTTFDEPVEVGDTILFDILYNGIIIREFTHDVTESLDTLDLAPSFDSWITTGDSILHAEWSNGGSRAEVLYELQLRPLDSDEPLFRTLPTLNQADIWWTALDSWNRTEGLQLTLTKTEEYRLLEPIRSDNLDWYYYRIWLEREPIVNTYRLPE